MNTHNCYGRLAALLAALLVTGCGVLSTGPLTPPTPKHYPPGQPFMFAITFHEGTEWVRVERQAHAAADAFCASGRADTPHKSRQRLPTMSRDVRPTQSIGPGATWSTKYTEWFESRCFSGPAPRPVVVETKNDAPRELYAN